MKRRRTYLSCLLALPFFALSTAADSIQRSGNADSPAVLGDSALADSSSSSIDGSPSSRVSCAPRGTPGFAVSTLALTSFGPARVAISGHAPRRPCAINTILDIVVGDAEIPPDIADILATDDVPATDIIPYTEDVMDTNWPVPMPEPSSLILLAAGLISALNVSHLMSRKSQTQTAH